MELKQQLNQLGSKKIPFVFVISYDKTQFDLIPLKDISSNIKYNINTNYNTNHNTNIHKNPIDYSQYIGMFNTIQEEIKKGNTYLINLTTQTKIQTKTHLTLEEIYNIANAKYKLLYKNKFVCFSPEQFCEIKNNKIYTYPMKGTIDANIPNAKEILINDKKELAEHTMVVDLLRNDLSIVSKNVSVEKFRYCEKIKAGDKKLIQTSSKISGDLEKNWQNRLGDIITSLLPAGSITGTPKKSTIDIIKKIENYNRGFFTGIFGVFDGEALDSAVMIRFIERKDDDSLVYKSGGGITCDSKLKDEYNEMIDKIYIP